MLLKILKLIFKYIAQYIFNFPIVLGSWNFFKMLWSASSDAILSWNVSKYSGTHKSVLFFSFTFAFFCETSYRNPPDFFSTTFGNAGVGNIFVNFCKMLLDLSTEVKYFQIISLMNTYILIQTYSGFLSLSPEGVVLAFTSHYILVLLPTYFWIKKKTVFFIVFENKLLQSKIKKVLCNSKSISI